MAQLAHSSECIWCVPRRQLREGGFLGEPIHELYYDEVQVRYSFQQYLLQYGASSAAPLS
jgi:hypothetical protein